MKAETQVLCHRFVMNKFKLSYLVVSLFSHASGTTSCSGRHGSRVAKSRALNIGKKTLRQFEQKNVQQSALQHSFLGIHFSDKCPPILKHWMTRRPAEAFKNGWLCPWAAMHPTTPTAEFLGNRVPMDPEKVILSLKGPND